MYRKIFIEYIYAFVLVAINRFVNILLAPKTVGRRSRKPGLDRKPRQAYSAKQLERLEAEFKVSKNVFKTYIRQNHKLYHFIFNKT